jgi:hypothetical protein
MSVAWKEYQEQAASFFRSLGVHASTDVTVQGVRTSHDVDVLVQSNHVGFEITWIIECKHWKTPVSKLHVLALREIVADVGADRGIILSESGFQSGAIEAANLTNVQVTSLATLNVNAKADIYSMRLRELYNRIENCDDLYWEIPKDIRIQYGLRADVAEWGYSGARVIELCKELLSRAFRGLYPILTDTVALLVDPGLPKEFASPEQIFVAVEPMILELEMKLSRYANEAQG